MKSEPVLVLAKLELVKLVTTPMAMGVRTNPTKKNSAGSKNRYDTTVSLRWRTKLLLGALVVAIEPPPFSISNVV